MNSSDDLVLDTDKVIKYALVHDFVEVYAGDVPFHKTDANKTDREHQAAAKLGEEFSEFSDLHAFIKGYESQADGEANFVYAVDKLISVINVYQDNGRSLRKDSIDLETLKKYKQDKFENMPKVKKYFEKLMTIFENEEDRLFGNLSTS